MGAALLGSEDLIVDQVWIHDTADLGLAADSNLGPVSVAISGSLVENASTMGVFLSNVSASVDSSVVRATEPGGMSLGHGIHATLARHYQEG